MPTPLPIGRLPVAGGEVDILGWHYSPHLPDNKPHRHTFYEVCLVGEYGAGEYHVEGKPHAIGPGTVFIARPGIVHQIVNTQLPLMELTWVAFSWRSAVSTDKLQTDGVAALFTALGRSDVWVAKDQYSLVSIWRSLIALSKENPTAASEIQLPSMTLALIMGIAQSGAGKLVPERTKTPSNDPKDQLVQTAIRFIQDNLLIELSVDVLANQLCISPRQCSRLFRDILDTSPAAYIADLRLEQASRLLQHTTRSVKEIAADVGMPDVAHFTRRFSKRFGMPPAQFRRSEATELTTASTIFVPNHQ